MVMRTIPNSNTTAELPPAPAPDDALSWLAQTWVDEPVGLIALLISVASGLSMFLYNWIASRRSNRLQIVEFMHEACRRFEETGRSWKKVQLGALAYIKNSEPVALSIAPLSVEDKTYLKNEAQHAKDQVNMCKQRIDEMLYYDTCSGAHKNLETVKHQCGAAHRLSASAEDALQRFRRGWP